MLLKKGTCILYPILAAILSQLVIAQEAIQDNSQPNFIPVVFQLKNDDIKASVDANSINFYFNPNELSIKKFIQWKNNTHDIATLEFTSGEPYRMNVELLFDGYEERKNISKEIEKLANLIEDKKRPPMINFTWGNFPYRGRIDNFTVRYTMFLEDGTPVRAVMNANFSKFSPAAEEHRGNPAHLDFYALLDASQESFRLLKSYEAESLSDVAEEFFSGLKPETRYFELSPLQQSSDANILSTLSPDEMHATKGFKIEISGPSGGKSEDNAWETCSGGTLNIEVADASVGHDQFHVTTPGHKFVEEIQLRGPMTASRKAILDWINQNNRPCRLCKNASLSFYDDINRTIKEFNFVVLDAFYFKNEALLFHIQDDRLHASLFNIKRTHKDGSQCNGPPRIFILLPTSGPSFMPLGIGGMNFDQGAIPYFNNVPSIALYNFNTQNLPLIGSISVGVTIVPPAAPRAAGDVRVEYFGQMSNPFPFTKN